MNRRYAPILVLVALIVLGVFLAWRIFGISPPKPASVAYEFDSPKAPGSAESPTITHDAARPSKATGQPAPPPLEATGARTETATPADTATRPPAAEKSVPIYLNCDEKTGAERMRLSLRIRVVNEDGRPLPDADISASGFAVARLPEMPEGMTASPANEHYDETLIGRSDAEGTLAADIGLRASFESFSYLVLEVYAATALSKSPKGEVRWTTGQNDYALTLTVPTRGGLRGRVVDGQGVSVQSVGVRIYAVDDMSFAKPLGYTFSDLSGCFEMVNLPPGEFILRATGDFYRSAGGEPVVIHAHIVVTLDHDIVVQAITRYMLKLRLPDDVFKHGNVEATFFKTSDKIKRCEYVWFNDLSVRLTDPPADSTAVEIKVMNCEPLRISLPSIAPGEVIELGEFQLRREPPDEQN